MRILGSIAIGLALIGAHPDLNQSTNKDSGNAFLSYCRDFMAVADGTGSLPTNKADLIAEGQCMGVVSAMIAAGPLLRPENRSCPPERVNIGQGRAWSSGFSMPIPIYSTTTRLYARVKNRVAVQILGPEK